MKISFWIPAVVLYVLRIEFSNSVQVGTVLFTTTDLVKKCWTESDKALLKARLIMQDVLPDPDCIDFSKQEAAVILLDYFHACYQIISTSTYGKVQNLMYIALSDALGGYLRAYVLPFTRRAYYAGQLKYSEAKRLFQLYDDIKIFLKTSGVGWAEPQKVYYRKFRAKPLVITGGSLEACNQLYTIEMEGKLHCISPAKKPPLHTDDGSFDFSGNSEENFREDSDTIKLPWSPSNHTSPPCGDTPHHELPLSNATSTTHSFCNDSPDLVHRNRTAQVLGDTDSLASRKTRSNCLFRRKDASFDTKRVVIPLPVLDDCGAPHTIAVPFRKRPLRNLSLRSSAFVLEYYYIAVIKCFVAKGNSRTDIKNFNAQFHDWLVSQVLPRLSDEKWYPAFGGVLRVMETIRKFGAETTIKDPVLHDIAYMFGKGVQFDITESPRPTGKEKVRNVNDVEDCCTLPKRHYLTAMLLISLIWIFIFCACAFYCQATRGRNLLYEGRSEGSSYSRARRTVPRKESKFVDFQFLVRFFKKNNPSLNEEQVYHCFVENDIERKLIRGSLKRDAKSKYIPEGLSQCKEHSKKDPFPGRSSQEGKTKEKGRLLLIGQGDVPSTLVDKSDETQQHLHVRLSGLSIRRFEKGDQRGTKTEKDRHMEQGRSEVQMLWKKPSIKFKRNAALKDGEKKPKGRFDWTLRDTTPVVRTSDDLFSKTSSNSCSASVEDETKGSSSEKRSSTCCCGESCHHSNSTSTNSSSQTQVGNKLSSATKQFFDKVITRRKAYKKRSTQESTADSESEGNDSYSSESDY